MASVSSQDDDEPTTTFDAALDTASDDIAIWIASPPRSNAAACTHWQPPAVGFDNFS